MKKSVTFISLLACLSAFSNPYSPTGTVLIRSDLYIAAPDGTTTLVDGDLTQYDPTFSNNVDGMDARKMSNFSENIGMIRGTTTLVIERRHTIENNDTIFYKIWNLSQTRKYQLQFDPANWSAGIDGLFGRPVSSYQYPSPGWHQLRKLFNKC
jgi:hypothetical protein